MRTPRSKPLAGNRIPSGSSESNTGGMPRISRRGFLQGSAVAAFAATMPTAMLVTANAAPKQNSVAIFGGGPGGLSAALELAERGFQVDVYERHGNLGGKSRSEWIAGTGTGGRRDLPFESGPHVYMPWYQHWADTLRRIPVGPGQSAFDNLTSVDTMLTSLVSSMVVNPRPGAPLSAEQVTAFATGFISHFAERINQDTPALISKIAALTTSGLKRQFGQLEHITLEQYMGPMEPATFDLLAATVGATKVDPKTISARGGSKGCHWIFGYYLSRGLNVNNRGMPSLLSLPADEIVFEPLGRRLQELGVRIHLGQRVEAVHYGAGRITGATVTELASGARRSVDADWYVMAMPQDRLPGLLPDAVAAADPLLSADSLSRLGEQWLGGGQFYMRGDAPHGAPFGEAVLGPWQAVAIDYASLLPPGDFARRYGDGSIGQWVSIDLQTWDTPGPLTGLTARECSQEQLLDELLGLFRTTNTAWNQVTRNDFALHRPSPFLTFPAGGGRLSNDEPLWGPLVGTYANQPDAATQVENLMVGTSYVKTTMGIDCMDSACEGGRQAANAILDRSGYLGSRAFIDSQTNVGPGLAQLWEEDDRRYEAGLPNLFDAVRPYQG